MLHHLGCMEPTLIYWRTHFHVLALPLVLSTQMILAGIKTQSNQNTKIIFGEVIGNPGLDIMDVEAIAKIAVRLRHSADA